MLGERSPGDILAKGLPVQVFDEVPPTLCQQGKEFAQRQLLVERRMAAIVDDDVERARAELGGDGAQLVALRLIANERNEPLIVELGKISQVDADHLAER